MSDGHTIDVGYVHTLTDDGNCRPDCPHPAHLPAERALADDAADVLANLATPMGRPLEETDPAVKVWMARYREMRDP